jgi:hypothetical protein
MEMAVTIPHILDDTTDFGAYVGDIGKTVWVIIFQGVCIINLRRLTDGMT